MYCSFYYHDCRGCSHFSQSLRHKFNDWAIIYDGNRLSFLKWANNIFSPMKLLYNLIHYGGVMLKRLRWVWSQVYFQSLAIPTIHFSMRNSIHSKQEDRFYWFFVFTAIRYKSQSLMKYVDVGTLVKWNSRQS